MKLKSDKIKQQIASTLVLNTEREREIVYVDMAYQFLNLVERIEKEIERIKLSRDYHNDNSEHDKLGRIVAIENLNILKGLLKIAKAT